MQQAWRNHPQASPFLTRIQPKVSMAGPGLKANSSHMKLQIDTPTNKRHSNFMIEPSFSSFQRKFLRPSLPRMPTMECRFPRKSRVRNKGQSPLPKTNIRSSNRHLPPIGTGRCYLRYCKFGCKLIECLQFFGSDIAKSQPKKNSTYIYDVLPSRNELISSSRGVSAPPPVWAHWSGILRLSFPSVVRSVVFLKVVFALRECWWELNVLDSVQ